MPEGRNPKWFYSVGFVLFILFCAGPFGLPLLFKSPNFSNIAKGIITLVVLVVTVFCVIVTGQIIQKFLEALRDIGVLI